MQLIEHDDGRLECLHDSLVAARWFAGVGAIPLVVLVYDLLWGARGSDRAIGLIGAAITLLGFAFLLAERSRFVFDPRGRRIQWSRRFGLRRREGSLDFSVVEGIHAATPIGDDGTPSRRIVLRLRSGKELALTAGFHADPDDCQLVLAQRLREMVGPGGEPRDALDAQLRALVLAGRDLDAIRELRSATGMDLLQAKARIDAMKKR